MCLNCRDGPFVPQKRNFDRGCEQVVDKPSRGREANTTGMSATTDVRATGTCASIKQKLLRLSM